MARLVTKFKYLKPDQEKPIGGYATYIATREGVEKIDESFKLAPATVKQQKLIEKLLRDFPDSATMLEYEDYQREKTVGAASEFITRAIEDNAHEILNQRTYADYIGTRPGAERFGSHGLFTDDGVPVKLKEVSQELNAHQGNVWTLIFVDAKDPCRPLQYTTIKHKVLRLIKSEDLRDDEGKLFKFSSHMFRRSCGVKLTELHLDDWTIAKLLGHKKHKRSKALQKNEQPTPCRRNPEGTGATDQNPTGKFRWMG